MPGPGLKTVVDDSLGGAMTATGSHNLPEWWGRSGGHAFQLRIEIAPAAGLLVEVA
jgi:hypothetical protein